MPTDGKKNRVDLSSVFAAVAEQLRAQFNAIQHSVQHGPTKGSAGEAVWREWLERHLPRRYAAGTGFVTDSKGYQSKQQDIVIYDRQYSPLLYVERDALFIPAESVYAVVEVKTSLTPDEIGDAKAKIASVRTLYRAPSQKVLHAAGVARPRKHGRIFGYVVATTTSLSRRNFQKRLARHLRSDQASFIDGGCILSVGAFSTQLARAKVDLRTVESADHALFCFFGLLFEDLKSLATVRPFDLGHYATSVRYLHRKRLKRQI
ncbi:hypothetical protein MYX77_01065 [Acidobacteriia bacterium AH_259_A11_L15]|nr:hypothetical protein [Acidobacteriia bacterium AH_259_A11_L15]